MIETTPGNAITIVKCICCLHNFLLEELEGHRNPARLADDQNPDLPADQQENGIWRREIRQPLQQVQMRRAHASKNKKAAEEMREKIIQYFNTVGSVPWQNRMI